MLILARVLRAVFVVQISVQALRSTIKACGKGAFAKIKVINTHEFQKGRKFFSRKIFDRFALDG